MDWQQIETQLRNRPLAGGTDSAAFWDEFKKRAAAEARDQKAPEPIGIGRWLSMTAAAAAAVLLAAVVIRPAEKTAVPMQVASTEVKSVDIIASHSGVIIMTDGADAGGTVLWIADLDLSVK